MAYTKQTWVTGDIVTADKLNHIEDGISNSTGVLYIPVTVTAHSQPGGETTTYTYSSDYSYDDIAEVVVSGLFPIATLEVNHDGALVTSYITLYQSWAETEKLYGAFCFGSTREGICFNSDGTVDENPHNKPQEESNT